MKYVIFLSENSLSYLRDMTTRQALELGVSIHLLNSNFTKSVGLFLILVQASQWTIFFMLIEEICYKCIKYEINSFMKGLRRKFYIKCLVLGFLKEVSMCKTTLERFDSLLGRSLPISCQKIQ